jgi:hypothetical protein
MTRRTVTLSRLVLARLVLAFGAIIVARPASCLAAETVNRITFDQVASKWTVQENGTWTVDADATIRAPKDNVSHIVRVPLTWSASTEKLTIVQARIDKPDGRTVVMPKDAVREDAPYGDALFHEFSDERRLIVTFTDAQNDDLLVVRTHREVFRPRVPGGFMAAPMLDRSVNWQETNFTISVPTGMPFHLEMHGFDETSEMIKDRIVHYLHSPKVVVPAKEVVVLGPFDRLPRFTVSTFRDWDEFAAAYATVFLPHVKVTPAISALAAKLTEGKTDKQEQAQALYLWVRDSVRYVPIGLEESKPDPHDAERVMTNLYGDDKDHVVLLYALLAARGIPAEIVLLNATNEATIPDPPNIRPMNHLILFLPGLNIYLDSTLSVAPFGVLAFGELGKPAIHLGGKGPARGEIPMPPSSSTMTNMKTVMTLDADGNVTGTTTTTARGAFGIWLRDAARAFGADNPAAAVNLLHQHGTPGSGNFSFGSPTSLDDDYTVTGTFRILNQSALLHGGFFAPWTGLRLLPRPGDLLGGPMFVRDIAKTEPTFCYPGIETEELDLTIPEGRQLGDVPPDTKIDTELVRYRSHWTSDGRHVTVSREFQSLLKGPVCEGQLREEMADVLAKVRADLVNPVGIRQDELSVRPASATGKPPSR